MKVVQVIDTLEVGGAERITVTLSNLLFEKEIAVSVVLLTGKGELVNELRPEIQVYFLNRKKRFDLSKMKVLAQYIKGNDIVHVHLKHNYRYVKLVSMLFGGKHSRIVFHDHSHNFGVSKKSAKFFKDALFRNVFKPNYYIGVSKENCKWAVRYLKVDQNKVFLLENTVLKQQSNNSSTSKSGIVLVSNIVRVKNIGFALQLSAKLGEPLTIYGKIKDTDYHRELMEEINQLGLKNSVTFITNIHQVQTELSRYKFAIHPSFKETGPLVLIEYLAQSLPFLATASGQVYQILKEELPEFFIEGHNIDSWVFKINSLDQVHTKRIGNVYHSHFSSEAYIEKCQKIYQKIISS